MTTHKHPFDGILPLLQCSEHSLAGHTFAQVFPSHVLGFSVIAPSYNLIYTHSLFSPVTALPAKRPIYRSSCRQSLRLPPKRPHVTMAKRRRSLQSLLNSSFLLSSSHPHLSSSTPTSPSTVVIQRSPSAMGSYRSHSYSLSSSSMRRKRSGTIVQPSRSPPPDFLLDEDPFANLSHTPPSSSPRSSATVSSFPPPGLAQPTDNFPRSPLASRDTDSPMLNPTSTPPIAMPGVASLSSSPIVPVTPPSGLVHGRAAHQKPAFAPRPSLPSLQILSQVNVIIPKKARKGKVGARLPFEPWDMDADDGSATPTANTATKLDIIAPAPSNPGSNSPPDFTHDLDFEMEDNEIDAGGRNLPHFDNCETPGHITGDTHHRQESSQDEGSYFTDSPPSAESSSPLSLTRSTSSSSASNSSNSPLDFSAATLPRNFSRRFPYDDIQHSRTSSLESKADPLSLPPEFDDFSYAESYSHYLSRPSSQFDSQWDFANPRTTVRPPIEIPAPHTSYYSDLDFLEEHNMLFEPSTSATTIRSPLHEWKNGQDRPRAPLPNWAKDKSEADLVDGSGWDGAQKGSSNMYLGSWNVSNGGGSGGHGRENGGGSGWLGSGGGQGGDDGDDKRRPTNAGSSFSSDSDHSTSEEDDQPSTDDYGEESPAPDRSQAQSPPVSGHASSSTDDDVPLAQRIPTALQAQRTIRKQVLDERDQRRKERALRRQQQQQERQQQEREVKSPQATIRPSAVSDFTHSRERATSTSPPVKRSRTATISGISMKPFAVDDLTKRLLKVQDTPTGRGHHDGGFSSKDLFAPFKNFASGRSKEQQPATTQPTTQDSGRPLRSARSFHKLTFRQPEEHRSVLVKMGRSVPPDSAPNGAEQLSMSHVPTENEAKPSSNGFRSPTRISAELDAVPRRSTTRQPLPPIHATDAVPGVIKVQTAQQRIFVGDVQRFNMVEIGPTTSAKDVVETIEKQGALDKWLGSGGWMLWEVAQDFGMERPIRCFEFISDISASWNKDKTVNIFVLKKTVLEPLLNPSAIPSSSPKHSGYVEWESKRGKWSKRWMELREHSLWLSKRDTRKEETFLCSLSAFDAYFVTRPHRSPKPFVFAVKSMDNMSFFENTADYIHIFSCGKKEGPKWIEMILLARSYVLHQERNVLFTKTSTSPKLPGHRPIQPLVHVSAPYTVAPADPVFEPGSLLAQ